MASQVDALQSFNHLIDNIPHWLTRLDELRAKCDVQYERFTRITQHGEVKLTRKKKQASTESLRPGNEDSQPVHPSDTVVPTNTADSVIPPTPPIATNTSSMPIAAGIPRKRRAGSELSGAPSNQCRYRSKNMVVVYYDSEIQEYFENLVKSIATARNNLRKGKNATTFKMRMSSMALGTLGLDQSHEKKENAVLDSKLMATSSSVRAGFGRRSLGKELKCFEDADRDLEEAQSFCERGAHQFLRDGDCHSEIERTQKRFIVCESLARREAERLKNEDHGQDDMEVEDAAEERTLVGDSTPPSDHAEEKALKVNPIVKIGPPPLKEVKFAGTGAIEIDDGSDSESMEIDMSAIRRTVRSTRV